MSSIEEDNLALAQRWVTYWNSDVDRMVDECYAPNCYAENMSTGQTYNGREELRVSEHQMLAAAPDHKMEVSRMFASGDAVTVEAVVHGLTPEPLKMCVVMTCADGQITRDHTYAAYMIGDVPSTA